MPHAIAWFLDMLLHAVFRSSGRHRATGRTTTRGARRAAEAGPVTAPPAAPPPHRPAPVLRAEDVALVRPYRVAHEEHQEREEALRRWRHRRTLVLAVHGGRIDLGAYLMTEAGR
ncbi:hypothetical protein IHE55_11335 [Streptomyces pactum]|uniref:Uncharacterized protein n=1 Tax=Streptomyces pactum TaxID=68249 RepID=A0ABS0NJI5_9ACTN|nr:hypothetical protein [Streptomyces pactum]MBH5335355.1 hypothetical protein [Streptomyces pactum]